MNLKESRKTLGQLIRRGIRSEYSVVTCPDHPLLLKGPDILIGGDGNLTAIYMPTVQEAGNNRMLRARYILSRLALPSSTRHLLLQPEKSALPVSSLSEQFAAELAWEDRQEVLKIAKDSNFRGKQMDLPSDVVVETRERFSETFRAVQTSKRLAKWQKRPSVEKETGDTRRARLVDYGPIIDGVRENYFDGELLSLPSVKSLIAKTTNDSFALEDSVPLQKSEQWASDLAVIGDVASFRGDPEKLLRAAAFAGWALLEDLPRKSQSKAAAHLRKHKKNRDRT